MTTDRPDELETRLRPRREFFSKIATFITAHPEYYRAVGEAFYRDYSQHALNRRDLLDRREKQRDRRGLESPAPLTRAGCRKIGWPSDRFPPSCAAGGRHHRYRLMYERFLIAADDVAGQAENLHIMLPDQQCAWADRILLMTWLISNPGAHHRERQLCGVQEYGWELRDLPDGNFNFPLLTYPKEHADDPTAYHDRVMDRYVLRVAIFGSRYPEWIDWAKNAWEIVQRDIASAGNSITPDRHGGIAASTAAAMEVARLTPSEVLDVVTRWCEHIQAAGDVFMHGLGGEPKQIEKRRLPIERTTGDTATATDRSGQENAEVRIKDGMAWQKAMARAEEHVKAHGGAVPSKKRLSDIVGCSRSTISKAIERSPYLRAREAERCAKSTGGREVPLTDPILAIHAESDEERLHDLIAQQKADARRDERQWRAGQTRRR